MGISKYGAQLVTAKLLSQSKAGKTESESYESKLGQDNFFCRSDDVERRLNDYGVTEKAADKIQQTWFSDVDAATFSGWLKDAVAATANGKLDLPESTWTVITKRVPQMSDLVGDMDFSEINSGDEVDDSEWEDDCDDEDECDDECCDVSHRDEDED